MVAVGDSISGGGRMVPMSEIWRLKAVILHEAGVVRSENIRPLAMIRILDLRAMESHW